MSGTIASPKLENKNLICKLSKWMSKNFYSVLCQDRGKYTHDFSLSYIVSVNVITIFLSSYLILNLYDKVKAEPVEAYFKSRVAAHFQRLWKVFSSLIQERHGVRKNTGKYGPE